MKRLRFPLRTLSGPGKSPGAFTLVEMTMTMLLTAVLSMTIYSLARSGTILATKSTGINRSHQDLRGSFDRVADHLLGANNLATLVGTDGTTIAPTESNYAPGVKFDRLIGYPYVLDPPAAAGSLASTATSLSLWRSTGTVSAAPVPTVGDVLIIPTASGNIRGLVSAVALGSSGTNTQKVTLTFSAAVGKSLSWSADQPQIATLIRPEAFIVMPKNGRNELRFYPQFEPMPTLSDASKYIVLTDQVGTDTGEGTPFSFRTVSTDPMLQSTLRIRETQYNKVLVSREENSYSSYFQLLVNLPSRLRPKTTN